jgi:hypothetical protein
MKTYKSDIDSAQVTDTKKTRIGCLKYALASIVLIAIFVLLSSITSAIQKQHRQELFCEILKPGMSIPEVLAIFEKYGNFIKGQYERGDFTTVLLGPSDIKTRINFGVRGIVLNFTSEVFTGAGNNYPFGGGHPLCE